MPDAPNVTDMPSNFGRLREVPLGSVWLLTHHRVFALNNPKRNMPCLSKVSRMVDLLSRFWQHLDSCEKARSQRWSLRKLGRLWVGAPYGIVKHGCLGNLQAVRVDQFCYTLTLSTLKDQEFWFREGWDVCPLEPVIEFQPHETSHRMRYRILMGDVLTFFFIQ